MNVFLDMLGCRLNVAEIESWARGFSREGHAIVDRPADADLIVLNTCAVTAEAERKSRQHARRLHRLSPGARIVLTGCFAELERRRERDPRATLPGVDLVVGTADKDRLVALACAQLDEASGMPKAATEPGDPHVYRGARTRAFLKVQDGCRHRCTFCIVTVARGAERSRTIDEIVDEIHTLEREGYREVVLTGVHLGGYGTDLDTSLDALVGAVVRRTSIPRIRLSSLEPWDLAPGFFRHWEDPRVMPHLHLPLQSGSDRVLRQMGRRCDIPAFRALVEDARKRIEGLTITTDIIVGFPGETDDDFATTLDTLTSIGFGHVHRFTYSPREGTAAARRPDQVPARTKRARMAALGEAASRMARAHRERYLGTERWVLWEDRLPSSGSAEGMSRWRGHTDNYLRVTTATDPDTDLHDEIEPVRLDTIDGEEIAARRLSSRAAT